MPGILLASSVRIQAAGGGLASFSDNFTRANGAPGSNWTIEAGAWDIFSNQLRMNTGGFADNVIIWTANSLTTTSGYMKAIRGNDGTFPRFMFRYTNASSPFYSLEISNSNLAWYRYANVGDGSPVQVGANFGTTTGSGVGIGLVWTGAGSSTIVRAWLSPTGAAPTNLTTWGGAAADKEWLEDPASPVDTGGRVGIGGSQSVANTDLWTAFSGGDVP